MLDLEQFSIDANALIQALSIEADEVDLDRQVEIAMFLWNMIGAASNVLADIKGQHLRPAALKSSSGLPGQQVLIGSAGSECVVHIPEPSYRLKKEADLDHLRDLLGIRFLEFFTEKLTVTPRREAGNLVARLRNPATKQALLNALVEIPGTPRVTLRQGDQK